MKIFVMPAIFPREDNKQCGIYIYEQCKVLKNHGEELVILDGSSYGYKGWNKCNKIYSYNSDVGKVYTNHTRGFMQSRFPRHAVNSYIKNLKVIFEQAVKEEGKPDLIYAHFTFPCGYAAKIFSEQYDIPYVVQEHYSLFLNNSLPGYLKNITNKTIEGAAAYFCVSESLKKKIESFTGIENKIGVINNLINSQYSYLPHEEHKDFTFFAAGNLVKSKKFDLLIQAFSEAFSDNDNIKLRIAGNGAEFENLKHLIKETKVNAELLGRLSTSQMMEEYQRCDCFVLLSEYETFGIVYREAMATGRPVIAVKNGGVEENWSDNFGIIIDKNNLQQSIDALKRMRKNYSEYDLKGIADRTQELYSGENIYKLLKSQFDKIKES